MGSVDIELDDVGEEQAAELRDKLKEMKFAAIITSPLKRARQTTEIIAEYHPSTPIVIADELRERETSEVTKAQLTTEITLACGMWRRRKLPEPKLSTNWRHEYFHSLTGFVNNIGAKIFCWLRMVELAQQFGVTTLDDQPVGIIWSMS